MKNLFFWIILFNTAGITIKAQNDSAAKAELAYKRRLMFKIDSVSKLGIIHKKKDTLRDTVIVKEVIVKKDTVVHVPKVQAKVIINQFDSLGKKDGRWIVYLDFNWKHIEDSLSATHYRYTYYSHGTNIYPMGPCGKDGYKLESSNIGRSKLLHGEYKWFDSKGRITSIHVLNHGEYVSCKEFFHSGKLSQHFDYTKKCKGEIHGWHVYIYDTEGELISESNMCRDKHGHWPHTKD